jgi:hypothetical protein
MSVGHSVKVVPRMPLIAMMCKIADCRQCVADEAQEAYWVGTKSLGVFCMTCHRPPPTSRNLTLNNQNANMWVPNGGTTIEKIHVVL